MKNIVQKFLLITACFAISNLSAIMPPPDVMKLYQARMAMTFGNDKTSEIYIFTDWNGQDSVKLEPLLEAMAPELMKKAKLYFMAKETVETENLNVVNFSVLGRRPKELGQYFKTRKALFQVASQKKSPTIEDINAALVPVGATYAPLNKEFADTLAKVNKSVAAIFQIKQYPTVVLYNLENSTSKTITALNEITQANLLQELDSLKAQKATP